jgi:hypothetical protein
MFLAINYIFDIHHLHLQFTSNQEKTKKISKTVDICGVYT